MEEAGRTLFEVIKSASDGVVHGGAFIQIFVTILIILLGAGLKALMNHFIATDNKVGKAILLVVALVFLCIAIIGIASSGNSPGDKKADIPQEEPHVAIDSTSAH